MWSQMAAENVDNWRQIQKIVYFCKCRVDNFPMSLWVHYCSYFKTVFEFFPNRVSKRVIDQLVDDSILRIVLLSEIIVQHNLELNRLG